MDNSLKTVGDGQSRTEITSKSNLDLDKSLVMRNITQIDSRVMGLEDQLGPTGHVMESDKHSTRTKVKRQTPFLYLVRFTIDLVLSLSDVSLRITINEIANLDSNSRTPLLSIAGKIYSAHNDTQLVETQFKHANNELLQPDSASRSTSSLVAGNLVKNKKRIKTMSISQMNLLLLRVLMQLNQWYGCVYD